MIVITGTIRIDPARRDAAIDATRTLMAATRSEAGCHGYTFSADFDDPGLFHLQELWEDDAALAAHFGSAHMAAFNAAVPDLGVQGMELHKWVGAEEAPLF